MPYPAPDAPRRRGVTGRPPLTPRSIGPAAARSTSERRLREVGQETDAEKDRERQDDVHRGHGASPPGGGHPTTPVQSLAILVTGRPPVGGGRPSRSPP